MKTITVVNDKTRRNLYITVASLYIVISLFFLINTEYQYRRTKQILVAETERSTSQHINQSYDLIAASLDHALSLTLSNSGLISAIGTQQVSEIEKSIQPLIDNFIKPQNAFFSIYTPDGSKLFGIGCDTLDPFRHTLFGNVENQPTKHIAFTQEGIYYYQSQLINQKGNQFLLFVGIGDAGGLKTVSQASRVIPFVLQYNKKIQGNEDEPIVFSYHRNSEVSEILKNLDISKTQHQQTVKVGHAYYVLTDTTPKIFSEATGFYKALYAIDISDYYNTYKNHLARLLAFIVLFGIVVILIIRLFHNRIINLLLSLEKRLEIKLENRTREVINYNDQLNQFFNATANGIRIIDKNFNVINVNTSFSILTGIRAEAIIGKKCYDIFPSNACHTTNCPLEQIKQGLSIIQNKDIRNNVQGKKLVYQYKARPFVTQEGDLIGIIEDFKDITELHQTQETLHQTQKQYETLLDSMPVGVFIRDFQGNMYYQNSYMNKVFGPVEEGRKNLKNFYPDHIDRFFEEDKLVDKYGLFVVEEKLIDNNGFERTYVTHKFKFSGANNTALIGGVSIDITKRKKAEHNSYVLTKAIVNSPIGVLITSPEGQVEFCNPEFEKYANATSENILGKKFPHFLPAKDNKLQEPIGIAQNGGVFQGELHITLYQNLKQWYAVSIAPVLNREGDIAHLIFVFDNITDRKEYEKQIVIAKAKAEESDRLKTSFLSNLSHEIRTPLNAILGFSSLLNSANIPQSEKESIPALLVGHSNELLNLINDLIDIAAIETNQFTISKTECKLNQVVTESFNEVVNNKSLMDSKSIKTIVKLGVTEDTFTILSDPKRLSQVVQHLLSNAIKFTSAGFVEFGYTFKDANNLLFYIVDTGVGLTPEEKNIIFNPFRQADDSRTRNFNGMGLGLAISKHIVERLGGKIWVDSTKDQGSTFYFTLPYIPVKNKFDTVVLPPKHKETFNWQSKTILLADDIDSNYKFIQTLLKPTGANLLWAKNGREAVDMVRGNKIDLILMDVVMPEIDGFEATRQIKRINNNIKVICQTAYPATDHQIACQESGMDSYLAKPIAPILMLKTIDEFISSN